LLEPIMTERIETLVVVADGGGLRAFEEPRRHGPLKERPDWRMRPNPADRRLAYTDGGTVTDRMGYGRNNVLEAPPADAAEARFLHDVADRVNRAVAADAIGRLVIIAPPKALGALRGALKPAVLRRIELTDDHDRCAEDAETLRRSLHRLRIPD
jgi:protein required for attachment to host cells